MKLLCAFGCSLPKENMSSQSRILPIQFALKQISGSQFLRFQVSLKSVLTISHFALYVHYAATARRIQI